MFQASSTCSTGQDDGAPLVITGFDLHFIVTEQLAACGVENGAELIKPEGRNITAPAVLAADASRARDVKKYATKLKDKGTKQAIGVHRDRRALSWFETLGLSDHSKVKRIVFRG